MRTALLTWFLPPGGSGLGRAAHSIAHGLAEAGADVTVITASEPFGRRRQDGDVTVIGAAAADGGASGWLRRRAGVGHLVGPYFIRKALLAEHARAPFDLVEASNWYAPGALVPHGAPPLVIRNSTPAIDTLGVTRGPRDRLDLRAAHGLERRTAHRADAQISNTATHREVIDAAYGTDGKGLHAVVELALDPLILSRGAGAGDPPDPPTLLFVGRDERRKGFRELFAAFTALSDAGDAADKPPVSLSIVGMSQAQVEAVLPDRPDLHRRITAREGVTDAELCNAYAAAGIVVAPSRYESYGLVYREAAAFGRPLLACAEDPAARAFVTETGSGILATACTGEAIRTAQETLLADADLRARLGAAGRRHATGLTRRALGERTLEVYRAVLSRSR